MTTTNEEQSVTDDKPVMVHVGPTRPHAVTFYNNQQKVNFQRISQPFYHDTPCNEVMVYFPLSEMSIRDKDDFEQNSLQVHFGKKLVQRAILRGVMVDVIDKSCLHNDGSVHFNDEEKQQQQQEQQEEQEEESLVAVVNDDSNNNNESDGSKQDGANSSQRRVLDLERQLKAVNKLLYDSELHREEVNKKLEFVEGMSRKVLSHDEEDHTISSFMLNNPKWWSVSTWKEHLEFVENARTQNKKALRELDITEETLREQKSKIEAELRSLHGQQMPRPHNALYGKTRSAANSDDNDDDDGEKQIQVVIIVLSVKEPIKPDEDDASHPSSTATQGTTHKQDENEDESGDYSLFVSYVMNHCGSWSAAYELHLHNQTQEIDVRYNAKVSLRKGDDLHNVRMVFSSAAPRSNSGNVPLILPPWKAGIVAPKVEEQVSQTTNSAQQVNKPMYMAGGRGFGMIAMAAIDQAPRHELPQEEEPQEQEEVMVMAAAPASVEDANAMPMPRNLERSHNMRLQSAKLSNATNRSNNDGSGNTIGGNTTFTLPTLQSLSANNEEVRFPLTSFTLQGSQISFLTIPSLQANAYTIIHTINSSEYLLLAGETSLFVDGSYIGKTQLPRTSINEVMKLNFGVDPRLEVKREMISESKSKDSAMLRRVFGEKQILRYGYRTTLINKKVKPVNTPSHKLPHFAMQGVRVCVKERLPISNDGELIVRMITPTREAYESESYANSASKVVNYSRNSSHTENSHSFDNDNNNSRNDAESEQGNENNNINVEYRPQEAETAETRMKLLESEGEVHLNVFVPYGATVTQEFIYEIEAPQKAHIYGMEKQK